MAKERLTTTIIAIVIILMVGFGASRLIGYLAYQHWTKDLESITRASQARYAEQIKTEKDSNKLVSRGVAQIKANDITMALITLNQAVVADPNFRDGWLFLGYTKLKCKDYSGALTALQKAEDIDPLYKDTYELLKTTYEKLDDKDMVAKTQERIKYLNKSQ